MKLFTTLFVMMVLLAAFQWGCSKSSNAVLATVNGEAITQADLESQVRVLKSVRPNQTLDAKTRDQLMDQMIRQSVLVQAAKALGLDKNPSLNQAIEEQRQRLSDDLKVQIENAQAQLDQLDRAVRTKALIDALVVEKSKGQAPSDKEVEDYYKAQQGKGQSLPALELVKGQIRQQILLDRLVQEYKDHYEIKLDQERIRAYESPLD